MSAAQSTDSLSPKALVEAMYAAYGAQDEARLRELLAEDVIWNQCAGFPGGARRRGVDDVLAGVLRGNRALWKGFSAKITDFIASEDRVVALGRYAGEHSESGQAMEAVFAHVYRVADGRIQEFEQITDTWPVKHFRAALNRPDEQLRVIAAEGLGQLGVKDRATLEALAEGLNDDLLALRIASIKALRSLTGQHFDFDPQDDPEDRRVTADAWIAWIQKQN